MHVLLFNIACGYISATSTSMISFAKKSSNSDNVNRMNNNNNNEPCNLNEPWLCTEYMYYESHTCTLNNVCIFNEYAFLESMEFADKMTHHCTLLPFDCGYFDEIKQCRKSNCLTQTLCNNLDVDGYEICLIKALLCYDEYCEPDLSALPFDYRLYDLCCHINHIKKDIRPFQNWVVIVLAVIIIFIVIAFYQIYSKFKKYSFKNFCYAFYKKIKYFTKYLIKHYISIRTIQHNLEYFYNEIWKKCKKIKRNIKYHYKNNKMMWCFFNLFDDYFIKFQDLNIVQFTIPYLSFNIITNNNSKDVAQKHTENISVNTTDANTAHTHNNNNNNNNETKKKKNNNNKCHHHHNKKKRKLKDNNNTNKKRKKSKPKKIKHNKDNKDNKDNKHRKYNTNTNSNGKANDIIITELEYTAGEEIYNDIDDDDDNKEEEEDDLSDNISITMIECPFCGSNNAQYLSYCDQCKNSMNPQKGNRKNKKNNKKNKYKKKVKESNSNKQNGKYMYYWTCIQCTYHNQVKFITCQMCQTSKHELNFSTKSTKKSKKKKIEKIIEKLHHNKQTHHNNNSNNNNNNKKKRVITNNKSTNTLNPNAKEFIFNKSNTYNTNQTTNHSNNYINNNSNNYNKNMYRTYCHHSPSRRLSKIPRLQKSVNPEPDYSPRHIIQYNNNNNNIPPRFQSTERSDTGTNVSLIAPVVTDLQKQLSDMEANVQEQLQVLDTLFPAIKPDLTHDIQSMQQTIAMNNI